MKKVIIFVCLLCFLPISTGFGRAEKGLSLDVIINALKQGLDSKRVARNVEKKGVNFELTKAREKRLRAAGANDQLIEEIRKAAAIYISKKEAEEERKKALEIARRAEAERKAAAEAKRRAEAELKAPAEARRKAEAQARRRAERGPG